MKKIILLPIILGSALLVAGGVLFAVAIANNVGNDKLVDKTYDLAESFENIDIDLTTADLSFKKATDGNKKVVLVEKEKEYHVVTVSNNTLSIKARDDRKWFEKIFTFDFQPMTVEVYLPAGDYANLDLESSTGNVKIPNEFSFVNLNCKLSTGNVNVSSNVSNKVEVKTSTGDIAYSEATCKTLNVYASTGNIGLTKVNVVEDIDIKVSTGRVKLDDTTFANLNIKSSTGNVTLADSVGTGKITIKTNTGDVKFDDADALELEITTDTGDVKGRLLTSKMFSAHSDTGKVKVPEFTTGGHCKITTDTGDIEITIKE